MTLEGCTSSAFSVNKDRYSSRPQPTVRRINAAYPSRPTDVYPIYEKEMEMNNEQITRNAYKVAEDKDIPDWIACFIPDGILTDQPTGVAYRGPKELGKIVVI